MAFDLICVACLWNIVLYTEPSQCFEVLQSLTLLTLLAASVLTATLLLVSWPSVVTGLACCVCCV